MHLVVVSIILLILGGVFLTVGYLANTMPTGSSSLHVDLYNKFHSDYTKLHMAGGVCIALGLVLGGYEMFREKNISTEFMFF